jgi:type VI secretion system secreted protein Hcp
MAVDMFLKLDGLDGESVDLKYAKWIDVLSFSWGISDTSKAQATSPGRLSPARKTQVSDFSIVKYLDSASPKLFEKCCAGDHIAELNFSLVRRGEKLEEFYKIKLNDVLISGVSPAGAGGSEPLEQVSFSFASSLISAVDASGQATSVSSCGAASFDLLERQR